MTTLKTPLPRSQMPAGTLRWVIDNVAGKSVMRTGAWDEAKRFFVFGLPAVGGPIPEGMPFGVYIDQTDDPEVFLITIRKKSFAHIEVIMGSEIFHKFGFLAPDEI